MEMDFTQIKSAEFSASSMEQMKKVAWTAMIYIVRPDKQFELYDFIPSPILCRDAHDQENPPPLRQKLAHTKNRGRKETIDGHPA